MVGDIRWYEKPVYLTLRQRWLATLAGTLVGTAIILTGMIILHERLRTIDMLNQESLRWDCSENPCKPR